MENFSISIFKNYWDTCPIETTLQHVFELIRKDDILAAHTRQHRLHRSRQQNKQAGYEKMSCPCFAVSVRFREGKQQKHICGYTGLCMADFDHVPQEAMANCLKVIAGDPHTLLAYTTISGEGIRVLSAYRAAQPLEGSGREARLHAAAFEQMNKYYGQLLGQPYDDKCKNITRLSGLAYDPQAYFCPDCTPFTVNMEAVPDRKRGVNRPKLKGEKLAKRASLLIEKQLKKEGLAYEPHHHNEYIMRTGYLMNAYGVPESEATEWAIHRFADYEGDVESIFRSCYRNTEEYNTLPWPEQGNRKGRKPREEAEGAVVEEIEAFLATQAEFRKNTVTNRCEIRMAGTEAFENLTDRHVSSLWCRMCKEVKAVRLPDLRTVLESEFVGLYNPFVEYFENLPPYEEGTDPIGKLAAQVHVTKDEEMFGVFFRKWLVALVASLLKPEVVNHEILVLIGRQGIYKTTWLNNLLPPELRNYFYLKTNSRSISKDDKLTLTEFALVCLEELDEMDSRELNQLKALTTVRNVSERAAYAHCKEVRPHIASFCGTSNNKHFLTDLTGNRRWMPFEVESIDNPYEHTPDYAAVFAQAYALLKSGYPYWLEEAEIRQLNEHNKDFEVPCLEHELILTYYQRPMEGEECTFVTTAQILARINAGLRQNLSIVRIGIVMREEKFCAIRQGGKRGYRVIELTGEQIEMRRRAMARYTE